MTVVSKTETDPETVLDVAVKVVVPVIFSYPFFKMVRVKSDVV